MQTAIVNTGVLPLYRENNAAGPLLDELLLGMAAEVLEEGPLCRLRTAYGVEGYTDAGLLHQNEVAAKEWQALGKMAARSPWLDVLAAPEENAALVCGLPRGGLVHPLGAADEAGWLPVALPDGRKGYAKSANLMPYLTGVRKDDADALRDALATTALSYLGTQYRLGGKTPLGIDAGGLVYMAYYLNGAPIWRGTDYAGGYGLSPIGAETLAMGDVIIFPGHTAIYLGDGMYIHATGKNGSDGVVLNNLNEASPFYREDLGKKAILACASLF